MLAERQESRLDYLLDEIRDEELRNFLLEVQEVVRAKNPSWPISYGPFLELTKEVVKTAGRGDLANFPRPLINQARLIRTIPMELKGKPVQGYEEGSLLLLAAFLHTRAEMPEAQRKPGGILEIVGATVSRLKEDNPLLDYFHPRWNLSQTGEQQDPNLDSVKRASPAQLGDWLSEEILSELEKTSWEDLDRLSEKLDALLGEAIATIWEQFSLQRVEANHHIVYAIIESGYAIEWIRKSKKPERDNETFGLVHNDLKLLLSYHKRYPNLTPKELIQAIVHKVHQLQVV